MTSYSLTRSIQSVIHLHEDELIPVNGNRLELRLNKDKLELPKEEQLGLFSKKNDDKERIRYEVESARSQVIGNMYEQLIAVFYIQ